MGKASSENDSEDSQNGRETLDEHIRLATPLHRQEEDTVVLSSERQLIAEAYDVDEFVYDGCGKTLLLDVKDDEDGPAACEPFIVIGSGKKLRFKNIRIEVSLYFLECMVYGVNFSMSVKSFFGSFVQYHAQGIQFVSCGRLSCYSIQTFFLFHIRYHSYSSCLIHTGMPHIVNLNC